MRNIEELQPSMNGSFRRLVDLIGNQKPHRAHLAGSGSPESSIEKLSRVETILRMLMLRPFYFRG